MKNPVDRQFVAFAFALVSLWVGAGANADVLSRFAPVSRDVYKMRQPDGAERFFIRDADEPHTVIGEQGWIGEVDGKRAVIRSGTEDGPEGIGYLFDRGRLALTLRDGKQSRVGKNTGEKPVKAISALWTGVRPQFKDVWKDSGRVRLWFVNPNDAGTLFAEIAVTALVLFFARRRKVVCFTMAVLLSVGGMCGVFLTGSRGALVAAVLGMGILILSRIRSLLNWKATVVLLGVFCLLAGGIWLSPYRERFTSGLVALEEGGSNGRRLEMLKVAPVMLSCAPGGWGFGESGRAYVDWFHEGDDLVCRDLVSSHLTACVEGGWLFTWGYGLAWLFVLGLSFVHSWRGGSPAALVSLASFAAAGFFNPSFYVWSLWVIPLVATALTFRRRLLVGRRLCLCLALFCSVLAAVVTVVVVTYGKSAELAVSVAKSGGVTEINGRANGVYVVDDGFALNGGFWWLQGQEIRAWFEEHSEVSAGFVRDIADLPCDARKVVLVGKSGEAFLRDWEMNGRKCGIGIDELIFVSPPFSPTAIGADFRKVYKTSAFIGEFAAEIEDYDEQEEWVHVVRGAELYIPNWLSMCLDS